MCSCEYAWAPIFIFIIRYLSYNVRAYSKNLKYLIEISKDLIGHIASKFQGNKIIHYIIYLIHILLLLLLLLCFCLILLYYIDAADKWKLFTRIITKSKKYLGLVGWMKVLLWGRCYLMCSEFKVDIQQHFSLCKNGRYCILFKNICMYLHKQTLNGKKLEFMG